MIEEDTKPVLKPFDVRVFIWILSDDVDDFLNGRWDVVWFEERVTCTWNRLTQISVHSEDFIKLKKVKQSAIAGLQEDLGMEV